MKLNTISEDQQKFHLPVVIFLCYKTARYTTVGFVCMVHCSWLPCVELLLPVLRVHGEASIASSLTLYSSGLQETFERFTDSRSFI